MACNSSNNRKVCECEKSTSGDEYRNVALMIRECEMGVWKMTQITKGGKKLM